MPAGDSPHSISERKAALRESPQQHNNSVNGQPRTSHFPTDNTAAKVGLKRLQPNGPLSPTNHSKLGNSGTNGHLVYVRRRLETDQSKGGTSARAESVSSISSKRSVAGGSQPQESSPKHHNNVPHTQSAPQFASPAAVTASSKRSVAGGSQPQESSPKHQNNVPHTQSAPRFASPAAVTASPALPPAGLQHNHSFGKQSPGKVAVQPTNDVIPSLPPCNVVSSISVHQSSAAANLAPSSISATSAASRDAISAATLTPNRTDPPRSSNQDWSDRFIRLQAFLRHNEQSGQEEYIRRLRSLSSVGRSKHAIELEQRAANLLIEEGKELQKMKVLNVLGKLVPSDSPSFPPQTPSAMRLPFAARR